jgi:hypothetical protein
MVAFGEWSFGEWSPSGIGRSEIGRSEIGRSENGRPENGRFGFLYYLLKWVHLSTVYKIEYNTIAGLQKLSK